MKMKRIQLVRPEVELSACTMRGWMRAPFYVLYVYLKIIRILRMHVTFNFCKEIYPAGCTYVLCIPKITFSRNDAM